MSTDTALLVIDVQVNLMKDAHQRDEVLRNIGLLLDRARASATPIIYVQHNDEPGSGDDLETNTPGWQIHPAVAPRADEPVVQKTAPDSFYQTSLQDELQARGIRRLVVAGGQTEYCVDTTARRALSQGYDVLLASDAHTTFDNKVLSAGQIIAFANHSLNGIWAGDHVLRVRPASDITFE